MDVKFDQLTRAEQKTRLFELANSALKYWGLEGALRLIKHRENAVYELQAHLRVNALPCESTARDTILDQSLKSELHGWKH